jgi:cobalamin biosynthesis protein CobD/CbiB
MQIDASDVGCGAVLLQEDENCIYHPVAYFSKKFTSCQRNYSTVEKECLSMLLAGNILMYICVHLCTLLLYSLTTIPLPLYIK